MSQHMDRVPGPRESSWKVLRRGLAILRRLMRGPADRHALLAAVREDVGPHAYSEHASAAERALKNDRAALRTHLGIDVRYDRRGCVYLLHDFGLTPWIDLSEDNLAAMATVYNAFEGGGPEAERVRGFLDFILSMLPEDRQPIIQRHRMVLSIDLKELDERPILHRVMQIVKRAVAERHRLGFNYRAAAQDDRQLRYHEVEPYGIVFRRGHYYLEAYDLYSRSREYGRVTQDRHRPFRLQGIMDDDMLRVLPERLPPGRRRQKRYPLRYQLAPPATRHGISRHFVDMTVETRADGSAIIEATTPDPWDAVRTLLGYGESCVVLGGDEVLRIMRRRVTAMAKNYGLLAFEMDDP